MTALVWLWVALILGIPAILAIALVWWWLRVLLKIMRGGV